MWVSPEAMVHQGGLWHSLHIWQEVTPRTLEVWGGGVQGVGYGGGAYGGGGVPVHTKDGL